MARRAGKPSPSADARGANTVTVVSGSIRTADDPSALAVKLSIWETEVTMRADGAELGHWPADAVTIRPIDSFSFEFVAEGDDLIFQPDNPDEFRLHPIVAGVSTSRRRKKKAKARPEPPRDELRWDEDTEAEVNLRKKRAARAAKAKAAKASKPSKRDKPDRPTRRERKAAKRAAKDAIAAAAAAREVKVPVVEYDTAAAAQPARTAVKEEAPETAGRDREPAPKRDQNGESGFAEMRHRVWIASLDLARRYDLFGLDRVPVNESLRGNPNHAHTWDHRVAPKTGPGSFICTICGEIRSRG